MSKKLIISILSIFFVTFISCGEKRFFVKNNNGKLIDKRLVGVWEGSESNKLIEGMSSEWKMTRNLNGKFSLDVKATINGELIEETEMGIWWIENGEFYELHNDSGKTDIYYYEVLNKKQIKFKAKKLAYDVFNENYEFIDTKITD